MDDEKIVISSSAAISPEAVAGKGFTSSMRGYQPAEVRQFLNRVADELAAAVAREAELRRALHETQTRAAHPELDEAVLTASLGEHAGRLIASARETAAAITAEAERTAAATLRDAEYRIARIRQEADTLMARRVDEADGVSASLRQSAEADARAVRDQAQAEAEAAIQAARSHGKEMVAEARAVRERMLGDLSRRRRVAEVQLEQLRVARGRLVEAYEVVRRTLEEVTAELAAAEPEARLAAEAVGRRMADTDPPPPLRIPDPPLRSSLTGGPLAPSSRSSGADRYADPPARPAPPASVPSQTGPFQPTHPAPPPTSVPDASVPDEAEPDGAEPDVAAPDTSGPEAFRVSPEPAPEPTASEPPPVPPAWIERAGGTGPSERSSTSSLPPLPPLPPMPPSVAGPVADEQSDPGTWAGAGFGQPRDPGSTPHPSDSRTGTRSGGSTGQSSSD
ncbi:MAG TPA: DivIVA domain-containing protein, partial [Acidimicrobiales bacterium]|nr:DivIVA domain-containing protein [Acidimicrobiales bacterium]